MGNPRMGNAHGGGHGRIVIGGSGRFGWPGYWPGYGYGYSGYGWPGYGYGGYGYQQPTERIICDRIPGSQECPDGTVVRTNADGSKTCCPPTPTASVATSGVYSGWPYGGYGWGWGWPRRRWW